MMLTSAPATAPFHAVPFPLSGAVCLLLISSAVTMVVPFGIGRVIDIIYTKTEEGEMVKR